MSILQGGYSLLWLTFYCSAWKLRHHCWNPKELTGIRTSGGVCGLIRYYAHNLTRSCMLVSTILVIVFALLFLISSFESLIFLTWELAQVLHRCRQLVLWNPWLTPVTRATLLVSSYLACHSCYLLSCSYFSTWLRICFEFILYFILWSFDLYTWSHSIILASTWSLTWWFYFGNLEALDDVKSLWPLWAGLHTYYNGSHNGSQWWKS